MVVGTLKGWCMEHDCALADCRRQHAAKAAAAKAWSDPNYGAEGVREALAEAHPLDFHDGSAKRGRRILAEPKAGANDRQVGGSHYAGKLQHWDLVVPLRMDYFIAQTTRYLSRAHKKNGREDYAKAVHYMDKRSELPLDFYSFPNLDQDAIWDFCTEQQMPIMAGRAFFALLMGRPADAREAAEWLSLNYEPS